MKIKIDDMTLNSTKVLKKLDGFLDNMESFSWFRADQAVQVYVTDDHDFIAVESVDYAWNFASSDHKLLELMLSATAVDPMPFKDFRHHVKKLAMYA